MNDIFVESCNIVSALGGTSTENYNNVVKGITGVAKQTASSIDDEVAFASLINNNFFTDNDTSFSKYENLLNASVTEALSHTDIMADSKDTLFVFSTTKGNVDLLDETTDEDELSLFNSAKKVCSYFGNNNEPVVISNACISGVVALIYAKRILETGKYKNIIVTGADCINQFIYSGFKSFMALSPDECKPFSSQRDGINLGEAAATIILTTNYKKVNPQKIKLLGGSITNDANHISGPSRTGEELSHAINTAIRLSEISPDEISFVSAHGTGTLFNDEMEARAFNLSGLNKAPVNSLKGYFGHTLGAAGLLESVISIIGLERGEIIPTKGFQSPVVSPSINVTNKISSNKSMNYFLKTASGFGGCNAALVFSKH